ncbi:MAG: citrate lyase acyl carrier protein [Firmicutes bacterium]|nr:citrate lyase acyl carrier protein [Bacillota bacterium]
MKIGIAGTLESSDVMITVKTSQELKVTIHSAVDDFFHDQIEKVIFDTLKELNINKIDVLCEDKGALDYTIKSRLITAIKRME